MSETTADTTPATTEAPAVEQSEVAKVRAWALKNVEGFTATRGRIAKGVQEAYDQAHGA